MMKGIIKNYLTLPNLISFLRIVSLMPIFRMYMSGDYANLVVLLCVVFISDLVDGEIARRFNMTSRLGKVLDMLSDNLVINSMLLLFALSPISGNGLNIWFVAASVIRSTVTIILSLASYMSDTQGKEYKTGLFGQINAFAIMCLIILHLLSVSISEFRHFYQFSNCSLYFFITLRILHMMHALNKKVKEC